MAQVISAQQATGLVRPGDTVMVGGFGLVGAPLSLIAALVESEVDGLTIISNNLGEPGRGLGRLLQAGKVGKAVGSFFTSNPDVIDSHEAGRLEVELIPQGTMAEAIRAGGAGIPAFYTPTGAGTMLAVGKETRDFGGREHMLQPALQADVAFIRAHRADELGNLSYRRTARNFNPEMATAAAITVAEVDEIVAVGELAPEQIDTPHLFIDHLVVATERLGDR
ncbi:MAG: CoA transferase subunit A [Baekduia sp.]